MSLHQGMVAQGVAGKWLAHLPGGLVVTSSIMATGEKKFVVQTCWTQANRVKPDQTPHSSDLGLHCLPDVQFLEKN